MSFRKPNIRSHKLDVQHFHRIRNYFVGCWFKDGRATCSWLVGRGDRSVTLIVEYRITNPSGSRKLLAKFQIQTQTKGKPRCWSIVACGLRHHKRNFYTRPVSVVHLSRQRSSDQNAYQRQKSNDETRVKNPQSCAWLVVRQNQLGTEDPNQICWPQKKTNARKCWPKETSHVMNGTIFFAFWTSWISRCFLAAISSRQQANCHVQESSGKYLWRRFGSGETQTYESGVKEPPERKEKFLRKIRVLRTDQELDQSYVSSGVRQLMRNSNQDPAAYSQERRQDDTLILEHQATGAEWSICKLSDHQETGARWWHSNRKDKWNISQDLLHWRSCRRSKKVLQDQNIEPENFEDRTIFMSMFNDIDWTKRGNSERCISNSEQAKNYAERFPRGHWSFLGPGDEKKWYGTPSNTPQGKWDSIAAQMVGRFKETGHPALKSISALSRGILRRKGCRETIHFNADSSKTELLIRTIHSATVDRYTAARHIFTCTVIAQITQSRMHVYIGSSLSCVPKIGHSSMRHVSPCASQYTSTSSLWPTTSLVLLSSASPNPDLLLSTYPLVHCEDPRQDGTSTEFHSSTGYEPKRIELNRILVKPQNQIIDDQDDIEEIGVEPLFCSQSLAHSAYDSAESIATPPTRTSKTNDDVRCWLHHWKFRNDRKMKDKHELITLNEKACWSILLGILKY